MSRILIVYGTTEGHTRKVSEYIAGVVRKCGHEPELLDSTSPQAAAPGHGYDAVIIGGSLHEGSYQAPLAHFVKANVHWLNRVPSAFFSVCLAWASNDPESKAEAQRIARDFLAESGWNPARVRCVAGALKYTQYNFFKRFVMRLIARREGGPTDTSQDYEFTDWDDMTRFVEEFLAQCVPARGAMSDP